MSKKNPNLDLERELWTQGTRWVVGVDEVGVGPLAGPVIAGAVLMRPDSTMHGLGWLKDSKRLSSKRIVEYADAIRAGEHAHRGLLAWGVGGASVAEIDRYNIRGAKIRAMRRAMRAAERQLQAAEPDAAIEYALIDGVAIPEIELPHDGVVKGDDRAASIAAASILAKDVRDRIMIALADRYPAFSCWASDKGYGSKAHREALKEHGPIPGHHRGSFGPVAQTSLF